ncbi:MAG TPA: hypothetical protein VFB21_07980 [Chthonomonadaceae bacterium]|nr:hypothetical protein [Chthonomonadaceae bacterium]
MLTIEWHVFLNVKNETKAHRVLDRLAASLETALTLESLEKDLRCRCLSCQENPTRYGVRFTTPAQSNAPAEALFRFLLITGRFFRWQVSVQAFQNGVTDVGIVANGSSVSGVTWAKACFRHISS